MREALFAAKICSYAQGMALLRAASDEYEYDLELGDVAKLWRGGCIIRARFLNDITAAYRSATRASQPAAGSATLKRRSCRARPRCAAWSRRPSQLGIPCLAMSASLAYFDAYRTERLPANLTQAQRDYFGAHTYRRTDREGIFHTEWQELWPRPRAASPEA